MSEGGFPLRLRAINATRRSCIDGFLVTSPISKARSIFSSSLIPVSEFLQNHSSSFLPRKSFLPSFFSSPFFFWKIFSCLRIMSSSDESVLFVGENNPGNDPSEATSRMEGSQSVGPSSSWRQSLRRLAAIYHRLIDEEEEEIEWEASSPGEEEKITTGPTLIRHYSSAHLGPSSLQTSHITQMREEFFIPDAQVIYTPGPQASAPFPQVNCLSFFLAQVRAGLRFPIPSFYREVAQLFQVPNSFRIMASFYMIFHFNGRPASAQIFSQCFCLKTVSRGFFLLTPRPGVSFLPAPNAPKKWKSGYFFALSSGPWDFSDRWIEETPSSLTVEERDVPLTSFINLLNERPYDCRAMIDERLLGHFGLSPHVEPLDKSLADIMFNKYFREFSEKEKEKERGGNTPPSHSARGTFPAPPRERGLCLPLGGTPSEGPAKKTRASSTGTPPVSSSRPSVPALPPPPAEKRRGCLPGLLNLRADCLVVPPSHRRRGRPPP
ncbi:UNVERIFIED_CONTAM: hypothetical protein Slati_0917400 [Sesamum latifolium]|uniref:Uncharacterized protein n=1 Tax=Sesamum latifolium TaxID=2727402 RepID=A0AAW2XP12_9LAMI